VRYLKFAYRRKKDRYEKDHRHIGAFYRRLRLGYGAFFAVARFII